MGERGLGSLFCGLAAMTVLSDAASSPLAAHQSADETHRTAVVSAFAPEMTILRSELADATTHSVNGAEFVAGRLEGRDVVLFLSGISVVNEAMTTQLALDRFRVDRIIFSGIAGGVDPQGQIDKIGVISASYCVDCTDESCIAPCRVRD